MNVEEFVEFAVNYLNKNGKLDLPGETFYNRKEAFFVKNGYYLIGLNPGLYTEESKESYSREPVSNHLKGLLDGTNNDFEKALGKCEKNIKALFDDFLHYPLKDVVSTNLIFKTTPDASGLNDYLQLANGYWPIHEAAIKELQPKVFISNGNGESMSAYSYLFIKYNGKLLHDPYPTYNKSFKIKVAEIQVNGESKLLIGFPHFSYFSIANEKSSETVKTILKKYKEYF